MGIDRRRFLGSCATALPALSLTGCAELIDAIIGSCPENTNDSGDINWTPSVLHPVFAGFQDVELVGGAPGFVRIWYPVYNILRNPPPILKMCVARWPVVLFLHGRQPNECGDPLTNYHQRWSVIPRTLARSGYVVIVPSYDAVDPGAPDQPTWPLDLIDWVRTSWQNERWVDKRPEMTAIVGHSWGAVLGARLAALRSSISAYVSLGGTFLELSTPGPVLQSIARPSLFMFIKPSISEDLDAGGLWNSVAAPKYRAVYPGEHFDYLADLPECDERRGTCARIPRAAADLVALFLQRYTPVPLAIANIPVDLNPAPVSQTPRQEDFATDHLTGDGRLAGLDAFASDRSCRIDLAWEDGTAGSRTIGAA